MIGTVRKGRLRIFQSSGARYGEVNPVTIRVEDEASGTLFFEAEIEAADVARVLIGNQEAEIKFVLERVDLIGSTRETKTECVPIVLDSKGREDKAASIKPFEVDGWSARSGDFGNHHRGGSHKGEYSVVFFRHLRADGTPVL